MLMIRWEFYANINVNMFLTDIEKIKKSCPSVRLIEMSTGYCEPLFTLIL